MQHDLQDLDRAISEEEIHAAIMHSASEKSPGPDGYIGAFYKVCWGIIKRDLIAVIKEIFELRLGCWNLLNSAHVVLIEKKEDAQSTGDYRPISMMSSTTKLLTKILANRLPPTWTNWYLIARVPSSKEEAYTTTFNTSKEQQITSTSKDPNVASKIGHSKGI
jgi:hypothetical protein